jgi:hypothetical protein
MEQKHAAQTAQTLRDVRLIACLSLLRSKLTCSGAKQSRPV